MFFLYTKLKKYDKIDTEITYLSLTDRRRTMQHRVVIASDSTCDLNPELMQRYDVKIVPLTVHLGNDQYRDGVDIDPDAIYRHYEQYHELPKTAAPNIADLLSF